MLSEALIWGKGVFSTLFKQSFCGIPLMLGHPIIKPQTHSRQNRYLGAYHPAPSILKRNNLKWRQACNINGNLWVLGGRQFPSNPADPIPYLKELPRQQYENKEPVTRRRPREKRITKQHELNTMYHSSIEPLPCLQVGLGRFVPAATYAHAEPCRWSAIRCFPGLWRCVETASLVPVHVRIAS